MRRPLMKVVLVVVAFMGITGMFLYKFKYEQMKKIVDGAGLEAVDRYLHSYNLVPVDVSGGQNGPFEIPIVTWVNVTEHFIFSAFSCHRAHSASHPDNSDFCAIGFGPNTHPNYECSIWYDLGKEVLSVPGIFSFEASKTENSNNLLFDFRCSVQDLRPIHRHPYAFVLKTGDHKRKAVVPIFKPIVQREISKRFVLCVYPDIVGNDWKTMIEFFTFHEIAGFTDVIAYDSGINYGFLDKMKYLLRTSKGPLKSLSVLRWDFPFNDPTSVALVQKDCHYRTSGVANLTALLNWNQFIVPNERIDIGSSIKSMDVNKPIAARFPSKRCCTDAIDDRRSDKDWPTILKKTLCIPNKEDHVVYVSPDGGLVTSSDKEVNFAEVMVFAKCQGLALSDLVPVFSMWKYSSPIMDSSLLKSWLDSGMFSIISS